MTPAKLSPNNTANHGPIIVYTRIRGMLIWALAATLAKRSALQLAPEA